MLNTDEDDKIFARHSLLVMMKYQFHLHFAILVEKVGVGMELKLCFV